MPYEPDEEAVHPADGRGVRAAHVPQQAGEAAPFGPLAVDVVA
ncbi:hypothetical protein RB199_22210 [Streptomyces libani]